MIHQSVVQRGSAEQVRSKPSSIRPLVLVVDADESARSVLEVALSRDGFEVWTAAKGAEAKQVLTAHDRTPDAVVLAAQATNVTLLALCAELKAHRRFAQVPVLLLSRSAAAGDTVLAASVGADLVLQTPAFARDVSALLKLDLAVRAQGPHVAFNAKQMSPATLLRALLTTRQSGRLSLVGGQAEVLFREGRLVSVRFGARRSLDALVKALVLTRGPWTASLGPITGDAELHCTLRELVDGVFPRLQRFERVVSRSLPLDAQLVVDFPRLAKALTAMPDEVNDVVRLFDGQRRVSDVLLDSSLDETLTLEVVTRLYLMGVLTPSAPRGEAAVVLGPRPEPKLFEPRARAAEELMEQLFAGTTEIRAIDEQAVEADEDWSSEILSSSGLEVAAPDGGWKLEPSDRAAQLLSHGLPDDLQAQLDAFRIRQSVEAPEIRPADVEMQGFADGQVAEGASLEAAMTELTGEPVEVLAPVQLRDVVAPVPAPVEVVAAPIVALEADAVEVAFFAAAPAAVAAEATLGDVADETVIDRVVEEPSASELFAIKPQRRLGLIVAGVLVVLGLLVAAEWVLDGREGALPATPVTAAAPVVPPAPVVAAPVVAPVVEDVEPPEFFVDEATPEAPSAALAEATELYESGRYNDAVIALEKLVTDSPNDAQAWMVLALARYDGRDSAGAQDAIDRVLELAPRHGRARLLQATVHFESGKKTEARGELEAYLALEPDGVFASEARALLRRY